MTCQWCHEFTPPNRNDGFCSDICKEWSERAMVDIVVMARAAQHDERLSDGALYGKLADEIERLRKALTDILDASNCPYTIARAALVPPAERETP